MAPEEQLQWEARVAKPAAAAAFLAGILLIGAQVLRQVATSSDGPNNERGFLIAIDDNSGALVASGILQSLSFLALAGVLFYLYRAAKARRPELPVFALVLALLGPVLLAVAGPILDLNALDIADKFLQSGAMTNKRAEDLLDDRSVAAAALGSGGQFALALSMVLINLNAMRVGLLSRFMGIIGIIVGGLYILPLLAGPQIVQLFWLLALGVLFIGRWPGGRGPAWEKVEAVPWPSAAEARERAMAPPSEESALEEPGEDETEPEPRPSRKRKRKRR